MLKVITSDSGKQFIVDSESIQQNNNLIRASFVWLHANQKLYQNTGEGKPSSPASYEYSSIYNDHINLMKSSQIISQKNANVIEINLYKRLQNQLPLTKEIREYLRDNYNN